VTAVGRAPSRRAPLLLAVSLVAVGALVAIQWRSFVLDGRDCRILGLLPVPRRTVMSAKLRSLVAVALVSDDEAAEPVTVLGLEWRAAADRRAAGV
jgi:hypothetical protein